MAPEKNAKRYIDKAKKWQNNNLAAYVMWANARSQAVSSVAEYLANADGYTLFSDLAKKYYAGIGSRQTPPDILSLMREVAEALESMGYTLRSGGAQGADTAFAQSVIDKEIFRPEDATPQAIEMASRHHPAWHNCKPYVRSLHGRNAQIVMGRELDKPVRFVVCWTYKGNMQGGTALGMRIASAHDIDVYNLAIQEHIKKVKEICSI